MEVSYRLYPYPVLAYFNDDYKDSSFEVSAINTFTRSKITLEFDLLLNNDHLLNLLENNRIDFGIHFECSGTMYRQLYRISDTHFEIEIPSAQLNGKVNICAFVLSKEAMNDYTNPDLNDAYAGIQFNIEKNNVLAVAPQIDLIIDKDYDDLKSVSSIFLISPDFDENANQITFLLSDLIYIKIPVNTFQDFKILSVNPEYSKMLHSLFIVPVLVKIFEMIKSDPEAVDNFSDQRWFRSLNKVLKNMNVSILEESFKEKDSLALAQQLADNPIIKTITTLAETTMSRGITDED